MQIALIEKKLNEYNSLATHPLQAWEWGEFRKKTGLEVYRFGEWNKNILINVYQLTLHKIPCTPFSVGYVPKSTIPSPELIEYLSGFAKNKKTIFIKFEPNTIKNKDKKIKMENGNLKIRNYLLKKSPKPLFTKYTFQIDLTHSEEELLLKMKPKTRYNVRLAQKKGVVVKEDNSSESFATYLQLQEETTRRQKFYTHNKKYHQLLWETLGKTGIAHILNAIYHDKILVSWMVFLFNNVLYYPYGGSSNEHRNLMPSNLMLWEAARWGKARGAKVFDLWGALGPNPDPSNPWYGFHRFKEGYGGKLVEFIGSYDYILNPLLYSAYNIIDNIRWKILNSYR